ncbi:hypothetical protein BJX76DRAFT_249013 [Aspergillus varians]
MSTATLTSTSTPAHSADNIPPRILSSDVPIARELGVLFGFLLASLVMMSVYAVIWRAVERREEERDRLRRQNLIARGVHHGRGGIHEKMLDQEAFLGRAELPVHGLGYGSSQSHARSQSQSRGEGRRRSG